EGDRQALRDGALLASLKQGADVVSRCNLGEAARCRERGVAVAGGNVENPFASAQVDGLANALSHDLKRGADHRVVAGRPSRLLALLDDRVIGRGGQGSGE